MMNFHGFFVKVSSLAIVSLLTVASASAADLGAAGSRAGGQRSSVRTGKPAQASAKFDAAKANAAVLKAILPWVGKHRYGVAKSCPRACGRGDMLSLNVWLRYDTDFPLNTEDMELNCYDLLFAGAVKAGVINRKSLRQMYGTIKNEARQLIAREATTRGSPVGDEFALRLVNRVEAGVMARWMGKQSDPVYSPGVALRAGDLIVLGDKGTRGGRHFAIVAEVGPQPMVIDILSGPVRCRPLSEIIRLKDFGSDIFVLRNPWETLHKAGISNQPMMPHPYGL